MSLTLMDLSSRHYKAALPPRRAGKFVQLTYRGDEYIVLAPKDFAPFHANIVEKFCEESCLSGGYYEDGRIFRIHAPGWVIVGGGKFELDTEGKTLILSDESLIYGKFDTSGLSERLSDMPSLLGYRIAVS